jgi:uncharacterized protein with gpF-like domain
MDLLKTWLKSHAGAEKSFARGLLKFFREQADRVADQVSEIFQDGISPDQVPLIFRPDDEHQLLLPIIRRNLGNLMAIGARAELQAAEQARKSFSGDDEIVWRHLPSDVRQRILAQLDEVTEQDYWLAIQDGVAVDIRAIIAQGISKGYNAYKIGGLIRTELGNTMARKRCTRIARTEVGGAMNAGHVAAMQSLGAAVSAKRWLCISDKDTRETHSAAHGQTVAVNGDFTIGGYQAPYPGHWSLPAGERANCRCTVLSVLNEGILAAVES